jgi:predicted dehydrogenase
MTPLRIGVIGCGLVAQTMHLPNIQSSPDAELGGLSDISAGTLATVGDRYRVPRERRFADYRDLLASDIDAVLILTTPETHETIMRDAAAAGKHAFVEKPMCNTPSQADAMIAAAERANVVLMVGYMKAYDPGFVYARKQWDAMPDATLIRVQDVCHHNAEVCDDLYGAGLTRVDDVSHAARAEIDRLRHDQTAEALGADATPAQARAYHKMLGLLTHDFAIVLLAFGAPQGIVSSHIWNNGQGLLATLDFGGERRCIVETTQAGLHWMDESITVYSPSRFVSLEFPSPFQRNAETVVRVRENEGPGHAEHVVVASRAEAFERELAHFVHCMRTGSRPTTDGEVGKRNVLLSRDLTLAAR